MNYTSIRAHAQLVQPNPLTPGHPSYSPSPGANTGTHAMRRHCLPRLPGYGLASRSRYCPASRVPLLPGQQVPLLPGQQSPATARPPPKPKRVQRLLLPHTCLISQRAGSSRSCSRGKFSSQMRVCSPLHAARGPRSVTRVREQLRDRRAVHAARGPRHDTMVW